MQFDPGSEWYCPRCTLCNTWVDENMGHLNSSRCRNRVMLRGFQVGALLREEMTGCLRGTEYPERPLPPVMPPAPPVPEQQYGGRLPESPARSHQFCANPKCNLLVHSDPAFGDYCCKTCGVHHANSYKRTRHGLKCEGREACLLPPAHAGPGAPPPEDTQELPPGVWHVFESVDVHEGVDAASRKTSALGPRQECEQAGPPVLVRDVEGGRAVERLRLPLKSGGWVTLAERRRGGDGDAIKSGVRPPRCGWPELFGGAEDFDGLWEHARSLHEEQERAQAQVRDAAWEGSTDFRTLLAGRDRLRERALQGWLAMCNSSVASLIREEAWCGGGEREGWVGIAIQHVHELEAAKAVDVDRELEKLAECRRSMREARTEARKAELLEQIAPDEEKSDEAIEELREARRQKWRNAQREAKTYSKKLRDLIRLADGPAPELGPQLADHQKGQMDGAIRMVKPAELQSRVRQVVDNDRELAYYDQHRLCEMDKLSGRVYGTTFDGKRCVIKRVDFDSRRGLPGFVDEVVYLVKLSHPLVVPLQCAFVDSKQQYGYLHFDRYECDLEEWIKRQEAKPEEIMLVCRIIFTMVQAVVWIHSQGVVHGDIKPSNFLWDSSKSLPRLHDFETAKEGGALTPRARSTTAPALQTWRYAAPELKSDPGCRKSIATDMYALGYCVNDVVDHLARCRSPEKSQLKELASRMTANSPEERVVAAEAEEACRELFHRTGNIETMLVKCTEIWYSQNTCSGSFTKGGSFEKLIRAIVQDPSYPLQHESLVIDVVKMGKWKHSIDNRRLYCFREAQKRIADDVWVRVKLHSFGPMFDRFMSHYSTRSNGKHIRVTGR